MDRLLLEKYEEYNLLDNINESLTLRQKISKFKKIEENKNIKFGIIVVTYKRADGTTPIRLQEAIESIKSQTYQNFKIYLIGDDYESPEELQGITESIDRSKLYYENMNIPGERLRLKNHDLWHSGSNAGANLAINRAISDSCNFMCRLDHDDVWTPRHLEYLAKGITRYPNAKLFATTALIKRYKRENSTYTRPDRGHVKHIGVNNINRVTEFWHSAIAWDLKTFKDLRYRNVREQMLTEPVRATARGGDRDLLERSKQILVEKNLKWVNIPIVTLLYRNKLGELPELSEHDIITD